MDRQIIYAGQIPLETDLLNTNKNVMIALSKLARAMFGTNTIVNGLSVGANSPAALNVVVQPGEIYALENVDSTAYSSITADTTHQIMKQGIMLDAVTLNTPAPGTVGQSINYLIQAQLTESDTGATVLPYYNASNPTQAFSGPDGTGTTNYTQRVCSVTLNAKAGIAAATGSQTTPSPDSGYVGLYVVTVANGQATVTSGNISQYAGAPVIGGGNLKMGRLLNVQVFSSSGTYTPTPGMSNAMVAVVGGGGAGGGSPVTSTGQISSASGGGSGAYGMGWYTSATIGASQAVTIGAAGTGSAGANGGNGGTSSFGSVLTAPGGGGGFPMAATTNTNNNLGNPGAPATVSSGGTLFNSPGNQGGMAIMLSTSGTLSGYGGSSPLTGGGGGSSVNPGNAGVAGGAPGAGGGGACNTASEAARAGGNGSAGLVIVWEYA